MAEAFEDKNIVEKFSTTPLSRQTISRRSTDLNEYVKIKLRHLIESCRYFSLCLDESNDITDISQLLIFARIV